MVSVPGGSLQALVAFGAQSLYIQGSQVNAWTMMLPTGKEGGAGGLAAHVAVGAQDVYIGKSAPAWWTESQPTTAPDPSSLALLGTALFAVIPFARRKRKV